MIIEGINPVSEALASGLTIERVYVERGNFGGRINKIVGTAKEKRVLVVFEDKAVLDKMSPSGRHQGVIATATEFVYTPIEEILKKNKEKGTPLLLVILDGVEDPHNVGAVIRAADSAGADGIIIPKRRGLGVNETVIKTSAGAAAHMAVAREDNLNDAVRYLKDNFINVYASDPSGKPVYGFDLKKDIAIIIGGEGCGVHELTRKLSDGTISLPQLGRVNSLNASVAAGILLYEAVRQRQKQGAGSGEQKG
jgi:rRNA methylase, putative, group 3